MLIYYVVTANWFNSSIIFITNSGLQNYRFSSPCLYVAVYYISMTLRSGLHMLIIWFILCSSYYYYRSMITANESAASAVNDSSIRSRVVPVQYFTESTERKVTLANVWYYSYGLIDPFAKRWPCSINKEIFNTIGHEPFYCIGQRR